jgi:hypothetical protein
MDHEVLDCPRMIAKLDRMNMEQTIPEKGQETKTMVEPQTKLEIVLLQMKETPNDHRDINLSEIFKEKEWIEARIGDFDIDYVLDEETKVNIMTERTWEDLGKLDTIPSLGGVGLFRER